MLSVRFEGWFQCRLPTNPDPADEPRGISGSTFALAGEPDLDREIRLQAPLAPRLFGQRVGVFVKQVLINGTSAGDHPLCGAAVAFPGARFEERNGIIAKGGETPIDPFLIEITTDGVVIRREDLWDPRTPLLRAHEVPPELLRRRQPLHTGTGMFELSSPEVADATGIADFPGYFEARKHALESELRQTSDLVAVLALRKRLDDIAAGGWVRQFRLGFRVDYAFEINGRIEVAGQEHLGGTILRSPFWLPRWPLRFWMGGFDSDTLCAYLRGAVDIPFAAARSTTEELSR